MFTTGSKASGTWINPAIRSEYAWLLGVFELSPVALDVYFALPKSSATTHHGTPLREAMPAFSPSLRKIQLPLAVGDDEPTTAPAPPTTWTKFADEWKAWRIDLWHETVHQLSHEMGVHNPEEPGRKRRNGTPSSRGHGAGWWTAIQAAAAKLQIVPGELDTLLDR